MRVYALYEAAAAFEQALTLARANPGAVGAADVIDTALDMSRVYYFRALFNQQIGFVGEHIALAETLGDEFRGGGCHAGRYESSIVLAADPDAVRDEARRGLPAVRVDLIEKMRAGARSFVQAGATEAYCGDPAAASGDEGRELVEALAGMIVQTVRETWPDLFE